MKVCSVCRRCYEDAALACSEENHDSLIGMRPGGCEIGPNYLLESLHESTATGDVYRAVNLLLKKPYLIKIVPPAAFEAGGQERFLSDAQNLAAVIHPNVVRVFESGALADGSLYTVTEHFTAQTLRECLENVGAPSEVTALTITRQAAEGLEALHAAGILHRTIRPENLLLTADDENRFLVKLQNIDCGALRQQQVVSSPEQNLADLRYFSPEQCAATGVDAKTDVYSLGVVLYETLAGRVPFDAPYADALIKKQLHETPPEVKIHSFDIRMLLTHTLTDALQKTTRTRLKSANALTRRIRHIEQLATHSSTPPPVMSYPATMNKTAVVFTPSAKAAKIEPTIPAAETLDEHPAAEKLEVRPAVEFQTAAEDPPAIEAAPLVEAYQPAVEEPPSTASETFVENSSLPEPAAVDKTAVAPDIEAVVEELPSAEDPPAIEAAPGDYENPPVVLSQSVTEEIPAAFETQAEIEELPFEVPAQVARHAVAQETALGEAAASGDLPLIEARAAFENPIAEQEREQAAASDFTVIEPEIEDLPAAAAELENPVPVEAPPAPETVAQTAPQIIAAEPAAFENEAPAQDAAAAEPPAFIDLTTTKLPPIELIVEKRPPPKIVITEIAPIFSLKAGFLDIHKTSEPVLVDWEQPDDVPTTTQALNLGKKELADAAFVSPGVFIDQGDADVIEAGEADSPVAPAARSYYLADNSVFAAYEESGASRSMPDKRKVLTGVGLLAALVLAVGGTLLSRQFLTASASRQTTAQSSSSDKKPPVSAEPARVSEADKPATAKPEELPASNPSTSSEDAEVPALPNYQPRETDARSALPASSETRGKKRVLKEAVERLERATQTGNAASEAPVFDKRGNTKALPDKKPAVKNPVPTPTRSDIFTRPRIVKTP